MRGNETGRHVRGEISTRKFLIPMRGNEDDMQDDEEIVGQIPNPHEG